MKLLASRTAVSTASLAALTVLLFSLAACGGGDSAVVKAGSTIASAPSTATSAPVVTPPVPPASAVPPLTPPTSSNPPTISSFPVATSGIDPALVGGSMLVASDGNIWFSNGARVSGVGKMTPAGVTTYPVTTSVALKDAVAGPLANGPDGNIWFADPVAGIELAGALGSINISTGVVSELSTPLILHTFQTLKSTAQEQKCTTTTVTTIIGTPPNTSTSTSSSTACNFLLPNTCLNSSVTTGNTTVVVVCNTLRTGPTAVARLSCLTPPPTAANNYVTVTCTPNNFDTPVKTCAPIAESLANSWVQTTCTGITPGAQAYAIVKGPDGNLWFTEYSRPWLGKLDLVTNLVTEYGPLIGPATTIAAGPDGNLWFVENNSATAPVVGKITTSGTITEYANTGLAVGTTLSSLIAGGDGGLWMVRSGTGGTAISRIAPATGTVVSYSTGLFGVYPLIGGLALAGDGNIWFTDYYDGLLGRIAPDGTVSEFGQVLVNSPLNAIAATPSTTSPKAIYYTDPVNRRIGKATLP